MVSRHRDFDPDLVLAQASQVFREKGYVGTSIRDLEQATGLTTGSLYNSFGDKAHLFDLALREYVELVVRGRVRHHLRHERDATTELRAFLRSTFEGEGVDRIGCLLTNSSIEAHLLEQSSQELLRSATDDQRAAFLASIQTTLPQLDPHEAGQRADVLLAAYHGILVLIRQRRSVAMLRRVTEALLEVVFPAEND
jgi:TetR/AcrR family transcriptional regulator, transcriptional repressor for nem operon